jgi:hypothetical protein
MAIIVKGLREKVNVPARHPVKLFFNHGWTQINTDTEFYKENRKTGTEEKISIEANEGNKREREERHEFHQFSPRGCWSVPSVAKIPRRRRPCNS